MNRYIPGGCKVLAVLCLLTVNVGAVKAEKRTQHLVTFLDATTVRDGADYLQLSPDGKTLAYCTVAGSIWLISTAGGGAPRRIAKGNVPLWSPDGTRIAFYSSSSKELQLWIYDIKRKSAEQITHLAGGIDPDPWARILGWKYDSLRYAWSPDGARIVFASRPNLRRGDADVIPEVRGGSSMSRTLSRPRVLTRDTPTEWTFEGLFVHASGGLHWKTGKITGKSDAVSRHSAVLSDQLFVVDVRSKAITQLTHDKSEYFNPDWSPDGREIVCVSSDGKPLAGGGSGTTNIYIVDVLTGAKTVLTAGAGDKRVPSWSPDGHEIAYLGGPHFGIQSLFVVERNSRQPINMTAALDRYVEDFQWTADGKSIVIHYQDGAAVPISSLDLTSGQVKRLSDPQSAQTQPAMTVSRSDIVAWQQSDPSELWAIRVSSLSTRKSQVLVDFNPQIRDWELGDQEVLRWKNGHGDELEGVLIKPVQYREGHRYPLIVDAYPGVANQFFASPMGGGQTWASRGYAVFYPNARTPYTWMNPFKSAEFTQAAKGANGWDISVDDVLSGVDNLIGHGIVDADRMALYGFSNGAGIVNYLVTRTSRFKCAVSVSGVLADWPGAALLRPTFNVADYEGGATLWDATAEYIRLSPVFFLDKVTTPMLLAGGDEEGEFLLDSVEMYLGLRRLGKEVTLLRYPNQGHGLTGHALEDFWDRENAFLEKCLCSLRKSTQSLQKNSNRIVGPDLTAMG
jgi:dipeptidyl aminopeptidase/acylaminoacyl peptidase